MMLAKMLYFWRVLDSSRMTELEFFETAYKWKFQKSGFVTNFVVSDVTQLMLHGLLPSYVEDYLSQLKLGESHD